VKKFNLIILAAVLIFIQFSLKSTAAEFPIKFIDDMEREVIFEKEVERVISLAPGVTEMIYALNVEDKLVGVSSAANYPEQALEVESVGNISDPNIEKIVSLKANLVIAESVTNKEVVRRLSNLGIKIVGFRPNSIPETLEMIEDIGLLLSAEKTAENLTAEMRVEYNEIKNLVDSELEKSSRVRVFYEIWSDPLITAGSNTFLDSIIEEAGGYNIGRDAEGSWPQFNIESLLAADPEVYIASEHSSPDGLTMEKLKNRSIMRETSAFRNNRLYLVNQDLVNRPSPRIVEGYKEFVFAIFPKIQEEIKE
jgi:iron complex transport system substrate-binding protein